MKTIGLLVNPIAGMGGRVGLKGTDGEGTLERAIELGAVPESPDKALRALRILAERKEAVRLLTLPGAMGEEEAKEAGFAPEVLELDPTKTAEDSRRGAEMLRDAGVEALLFAGGDGTARDVAAVLGESLPVIGIPAGVKIHSAVYATSPANAGRVLLHFLDETASVRPAEVMDIDEEAFREGRLSARLYGMMNVLYEPGLVQTMKSSGHGDDTSALEGMAQYVVEEMMPGAAYIIGSGSTTRAVTNEMGLTGTLLGQDVVIDRQFVAQDATEQEIRAAIEGKETYIVVSPIGGQGYIFGRGNQQISPAVIRHTGKKNIIVISTPAKLRELDEAPLLADTGDETLDEELKGYYKVVVGYGEMHMKYLGYRD